MYCGMGRERMSFFRCFSTSCTPDHHWFYVEDLVPVKQRPASSGADPRLPVLQTNVPVMAIHRRQGYLIRASRLLLQMLTAQADLD